MNNNDNFGIITDDSCYEKSLSKLDNYQRDAVKSEDKNIVIKAPAGSGKALCNGTKVLTDCGWKNIENLSLDDLVAGSDGNFHRLLGIYPQGLKQVYRVIFSDGTEIKCSPDHLWTYYADFTAQYTKTIKEIYENGYIEKYDLYIPTVAPINFPRNRKREDIDYYEYGLNIKHYNDIPNSFLYADKIDRMSLFCGIIKALEEDDYYPTKALGESIKLLGESLGFVVVLIAHFDYVNVSITNSRKIKDIIITDEYKEMTCIAINSPDHLFVTENFILTHNTTTLIAAIAAHRYNYVNDKICAITYTRAARAEMEARLRELEIYDVDVTTIHVWARTRLEDLAVKYNFKIKIMQESTIKGILQDLVTEYLKKSKMKYVNIDILYNFIFGSKKMDITDNYKRTLSAIERRYIQYKKDNYLYDFTDYPKYLYDVLMTYNETIKNIDALFVDEFQDVDVEELNIFNLVETNKKFFIGDAWQCQPFGAKVTVKDKNGVQVEKNIETVEKNSMILTYQPKNSKKWINKPQYRKVLDKQIYKYSNDYITSISTANGLSSSYTSNHRVIVHIEQAEKYVLYLMSNNKYFFKLGILNLADKYRFKELKKEGGKIWFLKAFETEQTAKSELLYIENCYYMSDTFDVNNLRRVVDCLTYYKLSIKYPLMDYTNCDDWFIQTYALNLSPAIMSCMCIDARKGLKAVEIKGVVKSFVDECEYIKVCGLKVEDELYVSDNIITHNSIFQFRGADGEVFDKLDNFTTFKLKQNYRSYQEIIDYATTVYYNLFEIAEQEGKCYIAQIMESTESKIKCTRGKGGELYVVNPYGYIYSNDGGKNNFSNPQALFNYFLDLEPMILCRTNKQVKAIKDMGYFNVDTVHQAKGLEYDNVLVLDTTISSTEDLNIAYVAMTRARDRLMIINWQQFELLFKIYMNHNDFGGF